MRGVGFIYNLFSVDGATIGIMRGVKVWISRGHNDETCTPTVMQSVYKHDGFAINVPHHKDNRLIASVAFSSSLVIKALSISP